MSKQRTEVLPGLSLGLLGEMAACAWMAVDLCLEASFDGAESLRVWPDPETHATIRRYVEATLKAK